MTRFDTTFNLPSLHKSSIGLDRMFEEISRQFENSPSTGYPPYNIIQHGDDEYEIAIAVAGFTMDQLSIVQENNLLRIEGIRSHDDEDAVVYLHKGIAGRTFKREFRLAEHVEVKEAKLDVGMLHIQLVRVIPEALQPKRIAIQSTQ